MALPSCESRVMCRSARSRIAEHTDRIYSLPNCSRRHSSFPSSSYHGARPLSFWRRALQQGGGGRGARSFPSAAELRLGCFGPRRIRPTDPREKKTCRGLLFSLLTTKPAPLVENAEKTTAQLAWCQYRERRSNRAKCTADTVRLRIDNTHFPRLKSPRVRDPASRAVRICNFWRTGSHPPGRWPEFAIKCLKTQWPSPRSRATLLNDVFREPKETSCVVGSRPTFTMPLDKEQSRAKYGGFMLMGRTGRKEGKTHERLRSLHLRRRRLPTSTRSEQLETRRWLPASHLPSLSTSTAAPRAWRCVEKGLPPRSPSFPSPPQLPHMRHDEDGSPPTYPKIPASTCSRARGNVTKACRPPPLAFHIHPLLRAWRCDDSCAPPTFPRFPLPPTTHVETRRSLLASTHPRFPHLPAPACMETGRRLLAFHLFVFPTSTSFRARGDALKKACFPPPLASHVHHRSARVKTHRRRLAFHLPLAFHIHLLPRAWKRDEGCSLPTSCARGDRRQLRTSHLSSLPTSTRFHARVETRRRLLASHPPSLSTSTRSRAHGDVTKAARLPPPRASYVHLLPRAWRCDEGCSPPTSLRFPHPPPLRTRGNASKKARLPPSLAFHIHSLPWIDGIPTSPPSTSALYTTKA
ncbi:MAG: hypothetical protein BJ554DRAFT_4031 [Olpidium bornovanus]|uniref:Uncharacterized protein n=1 Tax=Olpidium bornovanus TaxID=278681 RepID=A0A8H8A0H7_9FUNG|nr:MAG: hypothetical protein BJ554DRAFT_4031 [Olpidium bornovanus]